MNASYNIFKQLIDFLETYEEEDPQQKDLLSFAEWMISGIKDEPALNKKYVTKKLSADFSLPIAYTKNLDDKARFLEYISRISGLKEFYIRMFLAELPLNSRLEYLFLFTIYIMEKAKKRI